MRGAEGRDVRLRCVHFRASQRGLAPGQQRHSTDWECHVWKKVAANEAPVERAAQ